MVKHPRTLAWIGGSDGHVRMIEQTLLPTQSIEIDVRTVPDMIDAIRRLAVRGAPAIGVSAAFGVVLGVQGHAGGSADEAIAAARTAADELATSRPTAVNLFWALNRMRAFADGLSGAADGAVVLDALCKEANTICEDDEDRCRRMGLFGAELIESGQTVLTHCNAGALATAGMGTALAPVYTANDQGKRVAVYADETRPLLQGARITAWELDQAGIHVTVITDGMAARVMGEGKIDAVFVGSDRITACGDVCNKIGTFGVAIAAKHHGIPFYCVAPLSTVDPDLLSGDDIPIEQRDPGEIVDGLGKQITPDGVAVYNPAFDVTPAALVTAIITEVGVIEAPNETKMRAALAKGAAAS
jgi:methylthioribose-1-phosphate isomerase